MPVGIAGSVASKLSKGALAAKKSGNKLGFIRSLGSFKGLPTYALSLIAPFLMYKYLKSQDQYKKSKEN